MIPKAAKEHLEFTRQGAIGSILNLTGSHMADAAKVANEFHTEEGVVKNGKFFARGKTAGEPLPGVSGAFPDKTGQHFKNFIECVRSRKLAFDAKAEQFVGDTEANRLLAGSHRRPYIVPENV